MSSVNFYVEKVISMRQLGIFLTLLAASVFAMGCAPAATDGGAGAGDGTTATDGDAGGTDAAAAAGGTEETTSGDATTE